MSQSIDQRVVEMQFNNSRFEKNISQSTESLDRLNESLKLNNASKGIQAIENYSNRLDLSGIGTAVQNISSKFSAMGIIGITVLQNLTNKAISTGERFVKALSLDQIMSGWAKYADKTTSVQTIMAATAETWQKDADLMTQVSKIAGDLNVSPKDAQKDLETWQAVQNGTMKAADAAKLYGITAKEYLDKTSGYNYANAESLKYEGSQMDYVNQQMEKLNWFTDETSYNFTDMVNNIGKFTANNIPLSQATTAMQGIANWAAISGQNAAAASRAMYNMAQAIGVGSVKLMDWKSIENANMATAGFKQKVLEVAAANGTLKASVDSAGNAVYKTTKGMEVNVQNFSQTLSEGWFDKNVLLSVLEQYGGFTDQLYKFSEATGFTATEILELVNAQAEGTLSEEAMAEAAKKANMPVEDFAKSIKELASADNKFGREAFKAAQEAKTFQDAVDATKDAASTKWLNIFENIFGDYEKARHLWTDFANFLYDTLVAPLEKLEDLSKSLGNIDAVRRIAKSLSDIFGFLFNGNDKTDGIFQSLLSGFREIIPPIDNVAGKIAKMIGNLHRFASSLKLSEKQVEKFKNAGRGLASILLYIKSTFTNFWNATETLRTAVKELASAIGDLILELFGSQKDIDTTGAKADWFRKICDKLADVITKISDAIKKLDLDKLKEKFAGVNSVFKAVSKAFNWFIDKITSFSFSNTFGPVMDWIKEKFEMIKDYISNINWGNVFKGALGGGIAALLGSGAVSLVKKIKDLFGSLDEIKDSIVGVFGNISSAIKAFKDKAKVESLKSIAIAILLLAASLLILGLVDYEKAANGLFVIAGVLAVLFLALSEMSKSKAINPGKMTTIAASMLLVAAAILVLSVALTVLAGVVALFTLVARMDGIEKGVIVLAATLLILTLAMFAMSKMSPKVLIAAAALLIFSVALAVLAGSIALFALVAKMDSVWQGFAVMIAGLLSVVVVLIVLAAMGPMIIVAAASLLIVSAALLVLAAALAVFVAIAGMENAQSGILMLIVMLIALAGALILLGLAGPMVIVGAAALLIAAAACLILAGAVLVAAIALPLLAAGLDLLGKAIESALTNIGEGIKSFLASIGEALIIIGESIGEIITTIADALGQAVGSLGEGVAGAITDIIASVGKGIGEGITAISDAIGTFGENLSNAGLGIEALGNGVRSLKGIDWAGTALGIAEFAGALKKIKKNSDAVTSVTELLDVIQKASINAGSEGEEFANNYTSGLVKAVSNARSIIAKLLEEDFHPKITPVLDLSNVNSYINGSGGNVGINAGPSVGRASAVDSYRSTTKSIDYSAKLSSIIALNQSLLRAVQNGGDVYLDGNIITGYVNAHMGKLNS